MIQFKVQKRPYQSMRADPKREARHVSAYTRAGGDFAWYAAAIADYWEQATSNILHCGVLLINAKRDLTRHGTWEKFCAERLPFSKRTAEKLMVIAEDRRLKATHESLLPSCVATLYELREENVSDATWKKAKADGTICGDMVFRDARALSMMDKAEQRSKKAAEQNVGNDVSLWLADPPWRTSFELPYKTMS